MYSREEVPSQVPIHIVVYALWARGPHEGEYLGKHTYRCKADDRRQPDRDRVAPVRRRAAQPRRLLARLQLPGRRHDLFAGQPAAAGAFAARAREAAPAGALGLESRLELRLYSSQSSDP